MCTAKDKYMNDEAHHQYPPIAACAVSKFSKLNNKPQQQQKLQHLLFKTSSAQYFCFNFYRCLLLNIVPGVGDAHTHISPLFLNSFIFEKEIHNNLHLISVPVIDFITYELQVRPSQG